MTETGGDESDGGPGGSGSGAGDAVSDGAAGDNAVGDDAVSDGVAGDGEVSNDAVSDDVAGDDAVGDGDPDAGEIPLDEIAAVEDAVTADETADSGAAAWRIGPRRLRRVGLLAVGCVVAGVGLAIGYGQPPLMALFRGSVLGVFAFLLLTAALFVYWSVRQTMAR